MNRERAVSKVRFHALQSSAMINRAIEATTAVDITAQQRLEKRRSGCWKAISTMSRHLSHICSALRLIDRQVQDGDESFEMTGIYFQYLCDEVEGLHSQIVKLFNGLKCRTSNLAKGNGNGNYGRHQL